MLCPSQWIISWGPRCWCVLLLTMLTLITSVKVKVSARFLYYKVTLFPLVVNKHLGGDTETMQNLFLLKLLPTDFSIHQWILSATINHIVFAWEWCSISSLFPSTFTIRILLEERAISFPPFIYLSDLINMDLFYSIGYIQYYILLFTLFQLRSLGLPSGWYLCSFKKPPIFLKALSCFLVPQDTPGSSYIYPAQIWHYLTSSEPWFLLLENGVYKTRSE